MKPPIARRLLLLALLALLPGCDSDTAVEEDTLSGDDTHATSSDTGVDAPSDTAPSDTAPSDTTPGDTAPGDAEPDATTCSDTCEEAGVATCTDAGLSVCTRGDDGCLRPGPAEPCDDDDLNTADACVDGACEHTTITCPPVTQCVASAEPDGVTCVVTMKADTAPCDDGDLATADDTCDGAGACVGTPIDCTPMQCDASAEPDGDTCVRTPKPDTEPCDDGDLATADDTCDGAGACAGTPFTCTPDTCEASSTPNGVDCTIVYDDPETPCDDGRNTTRNDVCDGAGGCAGEPYTCPFPTLCEESVTPNGVDCTVVKREDGANCSDNETCTVRDACRDGVCVGESLCGNGSCDTICGEHAGTCAADCLTTVGECAEGENACTNWEGCHSTTTGTGLCADIGCGEGRVGDCFCEPECVEFGDCCQDMQAVCGCP